MNNNFSREDAKTRRVENSRHTRAQRVPPREGGDGYPGSPKVNIQQAVGQWAGQFSSQFVQGVPALFPGFQRGGQS
ncbi:hypothetical protein SAMN05421881_100269 [Nitrosomonas halophila]|uniref:Uncharacterized protein n=1 Tax=Nitrosomonas halophila TaxID=44576 RepID=A0A1H3C500_9PROT|nr:hypothetical protein SAMN05421881_100269 [Nitrosomonas halophila]